MENFTKYTPSQMYFAHDLKKALRSKITTAVPVMAALITLIVSLALSNIMPVLSLICMGLAGAALGCIVRFGIAQIQTIMRYAALKYDGTPKKLSLPIMTTPENLMDALVWKFNYPYCKGIHYDLNGDCAVQGRYGVYVLVPSDNGWALAIDSKHVKKFRRHFSLLEAITVRSCLNRFFNSISTNDPVADLKTQDFAAHKVRSTLLVTIAALLGLLGMASLATGVLGGHNRETSSQTAFLIEYYSTNRSSSIFNQNQSIKIAQTACTAPPAL